MNISFKDKLTRSQGFTLVELVVGIAVLGILSFTIVAVIVTWLQQYSISVLRNSLNANAQTAINRINNDVRKSTEFLSTNEAADANAPTGTGTWNYTSNSQLIMAQTPRDASGNGLFDSPSTFSGVSDSIVYYLNGNTLYRRVVPANYTGNVTLPLITCTPPTAVGGCPNDTKILTNIQSISFTLLDSSSSSTTDPASASAVTISVTLQATTSNQPITITNTSTTSLRTPKAASSTHAPFAVGPGGLELRNGSQIRSDDAKRDLYVKGRVTFSPTQAIGVNTNPLRNVFIGNQACGPNNSQVCTTEPITMGFGSIYADKVCATGQTTSSTAFGVLQTFSSGCKAPLLNLPPFNKAAQVAKMTSTAGSVTCNTSPYSCTTSLPANTKYTGSIGGGNAQLNLTINGDLYVMGNFGNNATGGSPLSTTITVAEGVKTRPIILVNGRIGFAWTTINKNSAGISPIFISFYSAADSACATSDSCNDANASRVSSALQGTDPIQLTGPGTMNASFYSYFGGLTMSNQEVVNGTVAAQRVLLDNGLNFVNLTSDTWPS